MAQTPVTKTLTSLPVYSSGGYNGHVLYTDSNIEYRLPLSSLVRKSELGNGDGFKYIGRCASIADLKQIVPTADGQTVLLEKYGPGCPTVNAYIRYDASDTTSAEDDIAIWVSSVGNYRWKAYLGNGYDLHLGGLLIDGSNFSTVAKKAINAIITQIVAAGRVNNVTRTIVVKPTGSAAFFSLTEPVIVPTIISMVFYGSPFIWVPSTVPKGLKAGNDDYVNILTTDMFRSNTSWPNGPMNQAIGNKCIHCGDGGRITMMGPGFDGITGFTGIKTTGLVIGNETSCNLDARDIVVEDVNIFGFYRGQVWGNYNTYMCGLNNFNISRCYNFTYQDEGTYNSGERFYMHNGTAGNITSHGMVVRGGGTFTMENFSMDFVGGDGYHFGPNAAVEINHQTGHLEGIQGWIGAKETPTNYSKCKLSITPAVRVDPRYGSNDYRGIRKMFDCPYVSTYGKSLFVYFDATIETFEGTKPNSAYACFTGGPDATGLYFKRHAQRAPGPRFLSSYDTISTPRVNASITAITTSAISTNIIDTSGPNFAAILTGGGTIAYGTSADADSDGYIPFAITTTSTTDAVQLFSTARCRAPTPYTPLWATCSVKIGSATGSVVVTPQMANYLGYTPAATINTSTNVITSTLTPIQRAITSGYGIDMTAQLAGSTLTTSAYQGMMPSNVLGYWQGNDFFVPGLKFSGFVGTIYVKLPVWWFEVENGEY